MVKLIFIIVALHVNVKLPHWKPKYLDFTFNLVVPILEDKQGNLSRPA